MTKLNILFATLMCCLSLNLNAAHLASGKELCKGIFPPNSMRIPAQQVHATGIGQKDFNGVLDKLYKLYANEIASHGGKFDIQRDWNDDTVNAFANQDAGVWAINMTGGMARHPAITADGFALVACHEIGHHLGGAPKYDNGSGGQDWASYEGAADYYGPLKCLRRYFASDDNAKVIAHMKLDPDAVSTCRQLHSDKGAQDVCIRSTMAGLSLAGVLADLESRPLGKLTTPDTTQVTKTDGEHPPGQCRLDTYFNASLCGHAVSEQLSNTDYRAGSCFDMSTEAHGVRPRCWFAP